MEYKKSIFGQLSPFANRPTIFATTESERNDQMIQPEPSEQKNRPLFTSAFGQLGSKLTSTPATVFSNFKLREQPEFSLSTYEPKTSALFYSGRPPLRNDSLKSGNVFTDVSAFSNPQTKAIGNVM